MCDRTAAAHAAGGPTPVSVSRRHRSGLRAVLPILLLVPVFAVVAPQAPAGAQARRSEPQISGVPQVREGLQAYAYTLRHKSAADALLLVRPYLTSRGTIELQPEGNTLVVRDTLAALGRIVPVLRRYDQPPQLLRMEVMVVRADNQPAPTQQGRSLPRWLEERLRALLRWDSYRVLAGSDVDTREGQAVTHEVGERYGVSFRMGSVEPGNRLKLHDFKVWQVDDETGPGEPLVEATLNLWLDKPKVLGLADSESSDHALMVVLTCEHADAPVSGVPQRRRSGGSR